MVTLREVAEAAGVHITTASAALHGGRGNTRTSEKTAMMVRATAEKMGYVRNEAAHRLRTGRSDAGGFAGGDLRNPFFNELAAKLETELRLRGKTLLVAHFAPGDSTDCRHTVELLRRQSVDFVILWEEDSLDYSPLHAGVKLVVPIGFTTSARPGIWLDLCKAVELSVSAMIAKNCRHLGFFSPARDRESPSKTKRQQHFLDACRAQTLPSPVASSWDGESWDLGAALKDAEGLWKQFPNVDGWIGFNDIAATALLATRKDPAKPVLFFDGSALSQIPAPNVFRVNLQIDFFVRKIMDCVESENGELPPGNPSEWIEPTLSKS